MAYREVLTSFSLQDSKLKRVRPMQTRMQGAHIIYDAMEPDTYFVSESGGIPFGCTYWVTVIRLADIMFMYHNEYIVTVTQSDASFNDAPTEEDWKKIFVAVGSSKLKINHYEYLEMTIEHFWKKLFNKTLDEMWCAGIITAHGDKGYGYQSCWEEENIPFNHGMLIFLLTYTKELGDTPKHASCQWVVDNYKKYLPAIQGAEHDAGL